MSDTSFDPLANSLEELWSVIEARKTASPDESYTAKLLSRGVGKCAQKMGEEAVETVIAAVSEDDDAFKGEAADLLYHLLVLIAAKGIDPADIGKLLADRQGLSGLAEKAGRKKP